MGRKKWIKKIQMNGREFIVTIVNDEYDFLEVTCEKIITPKNKFFGFGSWKTEIFRFYTVISEVENIDEKIYNKINQYFENIIERDKVEKILDNFADYVVK